MKKLMIALLAISITLGLVGCKKNWTSCSYNGLSWGMSEAEAISSLRKKDEFRNWRKSGEDGEWIVMTPKKKIIGNRPSWFQLHFTHGKLDQFFWMRTFTYNSPEEWEVAVKNEVNIVKLLGATFIRQDSIDENEIAEYRKEYETILIMAARGQEGPTLIVKYIKA